VAGALKTDLDWPNANFIVQMYAILGYFSNGVLAKP
jgi:hypothetical protein